MGIVSLLPCTRPGGCLSASVPWKMQCRLLGSHLWPGSAMGPWVGYGSNCFGIPIPPYQNITLKIPKKTAINPGLVLDSFYCRVPCWWCYIGDGMTKNDHLSFSRPQLLIHAHILCLGDPLVGCHRGHMSTTLGALSEAWRPLLRTAISAEVVNQCQPHCAHGLLKSLKWRARTS